MRKEVFRENSVHEDRGRGLRDGPCHVRPMETKPHDWVFASPSQGRAPHRGPSVRAQTCSQDNCDLFYFNRPRKQKGVPRKSPGPLLESHTSALVRPSGLSFQRDAPQMHTPWVSKRKSVPRQDPESQPVLGPPRLLCWTWDLCVLIRISGSFPASLEQL